MRRAPYKKPTCFDKGPARPVYSIVRVEKPYRQVDCSVIGGIYGPMGDDVSGLNSTV